MSGRDAEAFFASWQEVAHVALDEWQPLLHGLSAILARSQPFVRGELTDVRGRVLEWTVLQALAELAQAFDVHGNQIVQRKNPLQEGAAAVFGQSPASAGAPMPAPDLKALPAKIGELTLENDFLEGALVKAGRLSAKR